VIDALGRPQSVLVLGGSSEIALATVRALPTERLSRLVLAGRDARALSAAAAALAADGLPEAEIEIFDAEQTDRHAELVAKIFAGGDVDVTLLAVGTLGDQQAAEADPQQAVALAQASYVGPLSLLLLVGGRLREQGHGVLVVFSSVAARAARRANFVYGSAKAGLDTAALGLADALHGSGARVLVVRPGFVRTRMTAHLRTPPLAVGPDDVARVVAAAALRGRGTVVYSPPVARWIAAVLVVLPRAVLRRLPF
jgi:decaprenylphospho-beta-D-erythro-pentofuranosid-2-ulose 2-reductase